MREYEFHVYSVSELGLVSADAVRVEKMSCFNEAAAKTVARKLARREQAPIDVAITGATPWNDRYVGTASPKYPDAECKITVFERLD